ncbi:hypothetical protein LINGRAHAP2_LOCUS4412 [Linum grandiflorum]
MLFNPISHYIYIYISCYPQTLDIPPPTKPKFKHLIFLIHKNNMNSTAAAGMNLDMYHSLIFSSGDSWGFVPKMESADHEDKLHGIDGGIDEDDLLYAELSRQVLLLTADDDDDDKQVDQHQQNRFLMEKYGGGNRFSGVGNLMMNSNGSLGLGGPNQYFNMWESEYVANASCNWPSSWGNSVNTGTGVFIPYVANSKRRNRRGKKNGKNRANKLVTENKQQW